MMNKQARIDELKAAMSYGEETSVEIDGILWYLTPLWKNGTIVGWNFQEDNEGQRIDVNSLNPDVVFQTKINGKPFLAYI